MVLMWNSFLTILCHTHTHTHTDFHKTLDLEYVPGSQEWSATPSTAEGVDSVRKKLQAAKI